MEMKFVRAFHLRPPPPLLRGWNWLVHLAQAPLPLSQRAALPGRSSQCRTPHRAPLFLQARRGESPEQNLQTCRIFKGRSDQLRNEKTPVSPGDVARTCPPAPQRELGSPEQRGVNSNSWQQPQGFFFLPHLLFYLSNFCSSRGHLQGLLTKHEDVTSFSRLASARGVGQSRARICTVG